MIFIIRFLGLIKPSSTQVTMRIVTEIATPRGNTSVREPGTRKSRPTYLTAQWKGALYPNRERGDTKRSRA